MLFLFLNNQILSILIIYYFKICKKIFINKKNYYSFLLIEEIAFPTTPEHLKIAKNNPNSRESTASEDSPLIPA